MARFVLVPALFYDSDDGDELLREAGVETPKKTVVEITALNLDMVKLANASDGKTRVAFGIDQTGSDQLMINMEFSEFCSKYLNLKESLNVEAPQRFQHEGSPGPDTGFAGHG